MSKVIHFTPITDKFLKSEGWEHITIQKKFIEPISGMVHTANIGDKGWKLSTGKFNPMVSDWFMKQYVRYESSYINQVKPNFSDSSIQHELDSNKEDAKHRKNEERRKNNKETKKKERAAKRSA